MPINGNFWGGANSSKQYLMEMERLDSPYIKPDELIAHSFTNFNVEQIDRVVATTVRLKRGQIVEEQVVLRPARQTAVTYTVAFGSLGEVFTPLLQRIRRGNCELNIYIKRLCNSNDQFAHFYALLGSTFNPPTFVNDLITIDDSANVATQQAEARAGDMLLCFVVGSFLVADLTAPLYAVAVKTEQCADCDSGLFEDFYVGGGDGSGAAYLAKTSDRFSSMTTLTHGIASGNSVKALYADGDTVLGGWADDPDPATAATGGTVFSNDGGNSFALDTNLALPVNGVGFFEGRYIAVGGEGGDQAMLWYSYDGVAWTSVVSGALPATKELTSISVDVVNECFYVTGAGGLLLKGTQSGDTIQLAALSPAGVSTTYLWTVKVFGPDHIGIGGASGYYAETLDGGVTWANPAVPGSTAIKGLGGISHLRAIVATGAALCDRTILSDNAYVVKGLQNGAAITGDYTGLASTADDQDYAVAITDDGEVVIMKPFAPGS